MAERQTEEKQHDVAIQTRRRLTISTSYPPAVPTVREENSSIDNVVDDRLADAAAASDDIVIDELEADPILDALLDCADVTGDQASLCHLWENVARSIHAS
jgi:hypothetical protein